MTGSTPRVRTVGLKLLISLVAATVNVALATGVQAARIPLYFDSIGTIFIALQFGLGYGLLVAVATNAVLAITGQVLFPFVCCSVLTVLIAVGFRQRGLLDGYQGYLWMGLSISLANGVVGSILAYYLFEGVTEVHSIDRLVMGILVTGRALLTSVFWAGILSNLMDKIISTLVAFVLRTRGARLIDKVILPRQAEQ